MQKNIIGLTAIKNAVEKEINKNGWSFIVFPITHGAQSVLYIRKQDLQKKLPHIQNGRQLIKGGKSVRPDGYGFFDQPEEHINLAIERLHEYAKGCGLK